MGVGHKSGRKDQELWYKMGRGKGTYPVKFYSVGLWFEFFEGLMQGFLLQQEKIHQQDKLVYLIVTFDLYKIDMPFSRVDKAR